MPLLLYRGFSSMQRNSWTESSCSSSEVLPKLFFSNTHVHRASPHFSLFGDKNNSKHPYRTLARAQAMLLSPASSTSSMLNMWPGPNIMKFGIFWLILFLTTLWFLFCLLTSFARSSRHWSDLDLVSSGVTSWILAPSMLLREQFCSTVSRSLPFMSQGNCTATHLVTVELQKNRI